MPLRQDVTWSDGTPFTADDVVYTWQLMMNPQSGFDTTVEDKLKSVDKVDDFTVRFTYLSANEAHALDPDRYKDLGNEPVIEPLYFFGLYDAPAIYPRHKLREIVGDDPRHSAPGGERRNVGLRAQPDRHRTVTSCRAGNPARRSRSRRAAWRSSQRLGRPAFDSVVFRVMPDKNDSLTALSAGQIQVIAQDSLDAGDAPVLDSLPGVQARYTPATPGSS